MNLIALWVISEVDVRYNCTLWLKWMDDYRHTKECNYRTYIKITITFRITLISEKQRLSSTKAYYDIRSDIKFHFTAKKAHCISEQS